MAELIVTFERIGRTHEVPALTTPDEHPDRVAEAIYRYAGRFLMSRDYDVDVRLPDGDAPGAVSIGWGRMGAGVITRSPDSGSDS